MEIKRLIRRQVQAVLAPMIGLGLSGYFAYHLVEGDRGLFAWVRLTHEIRDAKAQAADIHAERESDEHRVWLLQRDHLDPDLLDEQARQALNLVAPGEVVILNDPAK